LVRLLTLDQVGGLGWFTEGDTIVGLQRGIEFG
jgi:hypothetical protein